ncbi:right-handed parallel beta-helix repeat-containing protein [Treponema sp. OMZ 855]|uniref:right-handed parallel beta-helix repeat-containing protein n=1 Tax=Treponema sp. OMZ 855 TaxID=1643512 RepID=UPI0020A4F201|nr:right-handed parallel beta-helix repeat-containing protein [Treponema sp. OMZ 855]UTC50689.1 hypothetical protein E4N65_11790 [Treponema sp. OMZ 855]
MRKVFTLLTGIFFTFLCTSCEQFTSDIDTYLGYWAAEIAPVSYSIDQLQKPYPTNKDGVLCIPSTSDVTVTINLRNPKNFTLVMPNSPSLDAGKVITFPGLSPQPEYGELKDYTLTQTANDKLELKYKSTFLQAHEWGNGDISPEITFITGRRVFRRKFNLNLKVDTAPALEYAGIGKTTVGTDNYYVLLFRVTGMDKTARGQLVHKDIKELIVTAGGGSPVELPLNFNAGKTDFEAVADLLAESAVQKLKPSDPELPSPTAQDWILRLKTDVKVGGPEKAYDVSIKDAQGVSSAVISAGTPQNKLGDVKLLDGFTPMAETPTSPGVSEANPKVFAGMSVKTLTAKAQSGAAITGAIYKKNGSAWTETDTVSGITPVTVNLPAFGTGETEALYKITLKARLSGYDDSDSKDFFIKSVRYELPVLKLKQAFGSSDNSLYCISAGTKGYVTEDIIPDAGQYISSNPLVIYSMRSGQCKLALSASAGTTVKYKLDSGTEQSPSAPAEIMVSVGAHTLEVWTVKGTIEGPPTTMHIKVVDAVRAYGELKNLVKNAPEQGTGTGQYNYSSPIDIKIGDDLNASIDTEIAITGGKKLELLSSQSGTVRTVNANNNGRIFKVSGAGTELTLNDIKLMNGKPADNKGGAAYVETGGILVLKGKTVITPSIGSEVNTPGKNDVCLDITKSSSIKVDGALTSTEPIVARITPVPYSDTHRVLTGTAVGSEYIKFSVTQTFDSTNLWKIKNDGKLEAIPSVINGSDSLAWQKLKNAVQNFPNGSIITINGEIKATNEGSGPTANYGEIVINKNLTIKGKTGAASDILNANGTTTDPNAPPMKHRIFKVTSGKMLTLENLTLKNGKAEGTAPADCGGAIYTDGGTINITNCTITGSEAGNGGAVYARQNSTIMMSGGKICANKASSFGGGMYIHTSTLKLTNNALIGGEQYYADSAPNKIKGNIAENGGGIYFESTGNKTFVMENSTVSFNTADGTLLHNDSSGGGVTLGSSIEFTMKGGAVKNNKAVSDTGNLCGGGIALRGTNSKFIMESGNPEISGNEAVSTSANASGGGIFVGFGVTLDIKSGNITGNDAKEGQGVYVSYSMSSPPNMCMSGSAKIDTNNDVYLSGFSTNTKIKLDGVLSGVAPVARITVSNNKYLPSTQVLDGDITEGTPQNYTKFTVTPKTLGGGSTQQWEINSSGFLQKAPVVINNTGLAWQNLRDAVAAAADGDTIIINGEIKATNASDNKGEITVNKNLTIKKADGAISAVLDANCNHSGTPPYGAPTTQYRIFDVQSGKTLKLENLTLKNGNKVGITGGGILVTGKVELTNCTIESCKASDGGAIGGRGEAKLTNTVIKKCEATSKGGAIYTKGGNVTMTNCTLTGNKAKNGGAIYAEKNTGPSIPAAVTITGGAIGDINASNANKATGTGTDGNGGGIYIGGDCTVTLIDGVQVIANTAVNGGGVYVDINSTFKMSGGTIKNNISGAGKGVYVAASSGGMYNQNGRFIMGGEACVGEWKDDGTLKDGNDVYLGQNRDSDELVSIVIDSEKPITKSKVACITPHAYNFEDIVLRMSDTTAVGAYTDKFTVTPQTVPSQEWKVGNDGKLIRK